METRPRQTRAGLAVAAVLVLLALSLAAAWGRKPPKEEVVKVTVRPLSTSEVMDILHKFPDIVPDYMASKKNDTNYLARMFGFSEVTAAPLKRIFPTARFYKGHDFRSPPCPTLMAIDGNRRYMMPDVNRLPSGDGRQATDKNLVALAKAFVIVAVGSEHHTFPEITFKEAKRIKQVINGTPYRARLKVRVDEQAEDWYFRVLNGRFSYALRRGSKGFVKSYVMQ